MPVPSLPTCSSRTRQPHPSFALGGCWGQLAWGLHDTGLGQSLLQEEVCSAGPGQSVQDWVPHMMGGQVRDQGCLVLLGPPGPCSRVAESSASSNGHCLGFCPSLHPSQGTARPRHPTRRALPHMPLPQSFTPL